MGLSHVELQSLLGVYALDALDDDERVQVDQHLATCPKCRAEVVEHGETASLLAHAGGPAPEGLWDRIAAELEEPPEPVPAPLMALPAEPLPTAPDHARGRSRRRWARVGVAVTGVAAAAVIGVLGWRVVEQDRKLDDMEVAMGEDAVARAAGAAMADPGARQADLMKTTGEMAAVAVVKPNGEGYLLADALTPLPAELTYQLWGVVPDGRIVSLGVLGGEPGVMALRVPESVEVLVITEEPAGGVAVSESPPMATGELT